MRPVRAGQPARLHDGRAKDRSGAVLVIVAISLVALLGFVALAIDVGHAAALRRQMQNAADACAWAGARLVCSGATDAEIWSEIQTYAGYNHTGTNSVTAYYTDSGGAHLGTVGSGTIASAVGVEVHTSTNVATFFGKVVGFAAFQPTALAAAKCKKGLPAIFAGKCGQPSGSKVIDWSGGNYYITGDIRANSDLNMSGTGNVISNSVISTSSGVSPSGLTGKATLDSSSFATDTSCQPDPVTFNIADYAPGGSQALAAGTNYYHHVVGNSNLSSYVSGGVLQSGIYYVEGSVNFAIGSISANVTIVATGAITISSGSSTWSPYVNDLLYDADISDALAPGHIALNVPGSGSTWAGIIYAPNSGINMSGSSNSSVSGSLIGNTVKLSGNGLTINSGAGGPSGVVLYE